MILYTCISCIAFFRRAFPFCGKCTLAGFFCGQAGAQSYCERSPRESLARAPLQKHGDPSAHLHPQAGALQGVQVPCLFTLHACRQAMRVKNAGRAILAQLSRSRFPFTCLAPSFHSRRYSLQGEENLCHPLWSPSGKMAPDFTQGALSSGETAGS